MTGKSLFLEMPKSVANEVFLQEMQGLLNEMITRMIMWQSANMALLLAVANVAVDY